MKFLYQYRTHDNVMHSGSVSASSREEAFALLKSQGIRPSRVEEAPGVFNKLFGRGKRWMIIAGLVLALAVICTWWFSESQRIVFDTEGPMMRRQVYGDPAIMEELERTHFSRLFENEADRFLAHYAQPGVVCELKGLFGDELDEKKEAAKALRGLLSASASKILLTDTDRRVREYLEIKRIVMWMREEYRGYMSDGKGSPERFIRRLRERQNYEHQIYLAARNEFMVQKDVVALKKKNEELRAIGLPTIQVGEILGE